MITIPGVRLPQQLLSADALDDVTLAATHAGVLLGFDRQQRPVTLRVHGTQTTRLLLVGGAEDAQLLALRVVAVGLGVTVYTPDAAAWDAFARRINPMLSVIVPDTDRNEQPRWALICGAAGNARRPTSFVDPSQLMSLVHESQLTIMAHQELTARNASSLSWADVVAMRRLTEPEAEQVAGAPGLPDAQTLTRLPEGTRAVISQRSIHLLDPRPTALELELIGRRAVRV